MRPVLFLAYAFPPENIVGARRPYRFARYLPEFGYRVYVVTATPREHACDAVHFVRDPLRDTGRLVRLAQTTFRSYLFPADEQFGWIPRAFSLARRVVREHSVCAVVSTSPPHSAHIAALALKRYCHLKWVADFRDPLVRDGDTRNTRRQRFFNRRLERAIFRHADAVIANTDVVAAAWESRYPENKHKIHCIWNGFDPEEQIVAQPLPPRPYRILAHIGEMYGGRHPYALIESIRRLESRALLAPGSLRFRFVGPLDWGALPHPELFRQFVGQGYVEYLDRMLPRTDALAEMSGADGLLLLDWSWTTQVPAKTYEYIRIGRPVLALGGRNSPAERILDSSGVPHVCVYATDSEEEIDRKMLAFLALPSEPVQASPWFWETFDARNQARALAAILDA
jgi:glycosyltransferase involved in cell wall biosynthesis